MSQVKKWKRKIIFSLSPYLSFFQYFSHYLYKFIKSDSSAPPIDLIQCKSSDFVWEFLLKIIFQRKVTYSMQIFRLRLGIFIKKDPSAPLMGLIRCKSSAYRRWIFIKNRYFNYLRRIKVYKLINFGQEIQIKSLMCKSQQNE